MSQSPYCFFVDDAAEWQEVKAGLKRAAQVKHDQWCQELDRRFNMKEDEKDAAEKLKLERIKWQEEQVMRKPLN
jgi:hypothetical protein